VWQQAGLKAAIEEKKIFEKIFPHSFYEYKETLTYFIETTLGQDGEKAKRHPKLTRQEAFRGSSEREVQQKSQREAETFPMRRR
jgi:hypothetical protein